jgi:hypothetical protein
VIRRILGLILSGLLTGCASQPFWEYTAPPGWKLVQSPEVFIVPTAHPWCRDKEAVACATRHPLTQTCTIFIARSATWWVLDHEHCHCLGFDHPKYHYTTWFEECPLTKGDLNVKLH